MSVGIIVDLFSDAIKRVVKWTRMSYKCIKIMCIQILRCAYEPEPL